MRVRCHHVGVYSDRHQLHGGAVCPARRGILSTVLQVLVLLFTHHLSPGSVGPPRQIKTPADQRAGEGQRAEQPVRAQQHGQQLQPEGQSHMRLGTGVPLGSRNTWDELNESWSVVE